jgi:hypothetical protein
MTIVCAAQIFFLHIVILPAARGPRSMRRVHIILAAKPYRSLEIIHLCILSQKKCLKKICTQGIYIGKKCYGEFKVIVS